MKLLHKINIQYLAFSSVVFVLTGIAISYALNYIVAEEMDEKLTKMSDKVVMAIHENDRIPEIPIFIEVIEIPYRDEGLYFSDTTIVDEGEAEQEDYRQLTATKNIKGHTYRIIVRESQIESDELFETIAQIVGGIFLILIITMFFINYRITKSIWYPFRSNLKLIQQFSIFSLKPIVLNKTGIKEFEELNVVISDLSEKVINDYITLKQFSEDASHEIQTPLAIISSKLENLMSDNNLNEGHLNMLKSVYSSALRLSRLNRSLILLTKIENRQFRDIKNISLQELVQTKLDEFMELIELNKLGISTHFHNDIAIELSVSLADILLNNLISNAINHNQSGGAISIETSDRKLVISNSGTQPIANQDKIFNRFYKENASSRSVGLGLAIVKKICDNQQITINYTFSDQMHSFTLNFHEPSSSNNSTPMTQILT